MVYPPEYQQITDVIQMIYEGTHFEGIGRDMWESRDSGGSGNCDSRIVTTCRSKGMREVLTESQRTENPICRAEHFNPAWPLKGYNQPEAISEKRPRKYIFWPCSPLLSSPARNRHWQNPTRRQTAQQPIAVYIGSLWAQEQSREGK